MLCHVGYPKQFSEVHSKGYIFVLHTRNKSPSLFSSSRPNMFFLSLPFASLSNLQVVIRLKHGDLDDLSLNLVPLPEDLLNKPTPSGYSLTSIPEQSCLSSSFSIAR